MTSKKLSLETILGSSLFQNMKQPHLQQIQDISHLVRIEEGEYIVREGELGDDLFLILEGDVSVEKKSTSGKIQTITSLGKGDVMGELVLFGHRERTASVRADNYLEFLVFDSSSLRELFEKEPEMGYVFMNNLASVLATRMVETTVRLANVV